MEDFKVKYYEALKRAEKLYEQGTITESLNYIFPELAESKDEKVRKALIELVKFSKKSCFEILKDESFNIVSMDAMLDWLEKQGKSADFAEIQNESGFQQRLYHSIR